MPATKAYERGNEKGMRQSGVGVVEAGKLVSARPSGVDVVDGNELFGWPLSR